MATDDDARPVRPGEARPDPEPAAPAREDARAGAGGAGVAMESGARTQASATQPVVVKVEQRGLGKGLTAFIVAAVMVFLLLFGGCTCAFTGAVGGVSAVVLGDGGYYEQVGGDNQIAVFHMDQSIDATSGITPELVRSLIEQVEEDPDVVALVVRCDCTGGGAAASEEIATYFARCEKPVVFSVGTYCASGAYMAASQSDWIVANPMSEVGAIGTLVAMYNLEGLYDMLGISAEVVKSSDSKDMGAEYRSLTDDERARLQDEVDRMTAMFVERVAQGRGLDVGTVEEWADGTTYIGVDAVEMGMVDELGTLDEALERAAELAGVDYDACEVVSFDASYSEFDALTDLLG